jgi:phosphoribosylamine---glycine ligase
MNPPINILVLGSGGREHAFAYQIAQSPLCNKLFVAPGNAGTAACASNLNISPTDFEAVKAAVIAHQIQLVVAGNEEPLVKGIRNFFESDAYLKNIPLIGPDSNGAQLEGSKDFSKQFMAKYKIPTAAYQTFTKETLEQGLAFLEQLQAPYVLKADGLAAGKGVVIPHTLAEAKQELNEMLGNAKFGAASAKVVIEEFLKGIELSVFVLTDGKSYKILPSAKDYKRIFDNDQGPNTGGMGAVSPVPFADAAFISKVEERIIKPTISGLIQEGIDYRGFIFIGLMNCNGEPSVIEYNVRMGDPETEVVIPRIKTDLAELFIAVAEQKLHTVQLEIDTRTAATVMLVSGGYPGNYEKGKTISGAELKTESLVFHAGTTVFNNQLVSNGGRVIAVTSFGNSIEEATKQSYKTIEQIKFDGMFYRTDIGKDLR